MDTRSKIISSAALSGLVTGEAVLVTGYFDILRASHIRALRQIQAGMLVVAVRPHPGAVLPLRARAELVAALRMVDYVVIADDREVDTLVTALRPARIVHLEDADLERARELKQHVQSRQSV
jgi:glycerol-3-phosphate cytidylyltransferase-like family protein